MAAENKTELPSGSVDAIPKGASADESVKAAKLGTTGAFPFQVTARAPNPSDALKNVSDMLEIQKIEKNDSISMNFEVPDAGATEIVDADQHQPPPNHEGKIEYKKVIRLLNAHVVSELTGEDKMLVKVAKLPPEFETKDVVLTVENGMLVIELNTSQSVLDEYGKIKRFAELPAGATGSVISSLMEGETLTITIALEKLKPEEKPKSIISKIWRFAKGTMKKVGPACLVMCGKVVLDETNKDEPNAEPEAEPNAE